MNPRKWFGIVLLYTAITLLSVYLIPSNSTLSYLRDVLAFVFVAFLPGYCLISLLFTEGKLDFIEKAVLSVALSFSLAGISGLFLGLSSIGIDISSVTEALSLIVIILAVLAFLRKSGLMKFVSRKLGAKNSIPKPSEIP